MLSQQDAVAQAQLCLTQVRKGILTRDQAIDAIHVFASGDAMVEAYTTDLFTTALSRGARSVS